MGSDMTRGNVLTALVRFTVPLILSGLLQQVYYITDSIIVGNYVGELGLAAVGVSSPVFYVFIYIISGLVSGYTILISHYYGARDDDKVSKLTNTFALFSVVSACIVSAAGWLVKDSILVMLNTPGEVLQAGSEYLAIAFVGVPFIALYNLFGSMLRAIGDSKTPLYGIVLSSVANIILDLVLINVFGLGIKGAAIATVAAQMAAGAYLGVYIHRRHPMFRISLRRSQRDILLFYDSLKLGVPQVIQSSITSVGHLLLQNVMNSFGVDVVTAITTAYKIDSLTLLPLVNISAAISIFAGQNVGANNPARAQEGLKTGVILSAAFAVLVTFFVVSFGEALIKVFGVSDGVAAIGGRFFRTCAVFYPVFGVQNAYIGFLQGNKDVVFASACSIIALSVRVLLSYGLSSALGSDVIAVSEICSWVIGAAICFARYRGGRWKKISGLSAAGVANRV
ncbi:MAG: MATE family efflux transporter [Limnochordia bacterium]|jgi:putative MATE family efflux protein